MQGEELAVGSKIKAASITTDTIFLAWHQNCTDEFPESLNFAIDKEQEKRKQDAPQQPCSHPPSLERSKVDKKKKEVVGAKGSSTKAYISGSRGGIKAVIDFDINTNKQSTVSV
ncbi:uncharacterized protein FRV6_10237 [Fusarium oxysporum]|uniref:Uncharacterized protein n=1 Tax=Fusarium oxysporum TaxID=5507 RepID=A0A2H3TMW9_FUSOX|nr:uncharacterized protein FRV6_10237 [Fusarium oxysporum]